MLRLASLYILPQLFYLWLVACEDLTLDPNKTGCLVVKSSIEKMMDSKIFKAGDHNYSLQRAALVSEFGEKRVIGVDGRTVGIWQINEKNLEDAQNKLDTLSDVKTGLETQFKIKNFNSFTLEDIKKPFYNLLTVCILIAGKAIPDRDKIEEQSEFWTNEVVTITGSDKSNFKKKFIADAAFLDNHQNEIDPKTQCLARVHQPSDIVLAMVLSVMPGWETGSDKKFFEAIVNSFENSMKDGDVQVGLVMTDFTNKDDQLHLTSDMKVIKRHYNEKKEKASINLLLKAIDLVKEEFNNNGRAKDDKIVRRLAVFLMDYKTTEDDQDIKNKINELLKLGINVFAIGEGSASGGNTIKSLASKPEYARFYARYTAFDADIEDIADALSPIPAQLNFHQVADIKKTAECSMPDEISQFCQPSIFFQKNLTIASLKHKQTRFEVTIPANKNFYLNLQSKKLKFIVYTANNYSPNDVRYDEKFEVHPGSATSKVINYEGNGQMVVFNMNIYVDGVNLNCGTRCSEAEDVNAMLTLVESNKPPVEYNNLEESGCSMDDIALDCTNQTKDIIQLQLRLKDLQHLQMRHFELIVKPTVRTILDIQTEDLQLSVHVAVNSFRSKLKFDQRVVVEPGSKVSFPIEGYYQPEDDNETKTASLFIAIAANSSDSDCGEDCSGEDVPVVLTLVQPSNLPVDFIVERDKDEVCSNKTELLLNCAKQSNGIIQSKVILKEMKKRKKRNKSDKEARYFKVKCNTEVEAKLVTEKFTLKVYAAINYFPNETKNDKKAEISPQSQPIFSIKCKDPAATVFFLVEEPLDPDCITKCFPSKSDCIKCSEENVTVSLSLVHLTDPVEPSDKSCSKLDWIHNQVIDCTNQPNGVLQSFLSLKDLQTGKTRYLEMKIESLVEAKLQWATKSNSLVVYAAIDYIPSKEKHYGRILVEPPSMENTDNKSPETTMLTIKNIDNQPAGKNSTLFVIVEAVSSNPMCNNNCQKEATVNIALLQTAPVDLEFTKLESRTSKSCSISDYLLNCTSTHVNDSIQYLLTLKDLQKQQKRYFEVEMGERNLATMEWTTKSVDLDVYAAIDFIPSEMNYEHKIEFNPTSPPNKKSLSVKTKGYKPAGKGATLFVIVHSRCEKWKCGKLHSENVTAILTLLQESTNSFSSSNNQLSLLALFLGFLIIIIFKKKFGFSG